MFQTWERHTHTHSWCFIHKLETHIFWNQSTTMDEMQTTQVPLCDIIENNGGWNVCTEFLKQCFVISRGVCRCCNVHSKCAKRGQKTPWLHVLSFNWCSIIKDWKDGWFLLLFLTPVEHFSCSHATHGWNHGVIMWFRLVNHMSDSRSAVQQEQQQGLACTLSLSLS